MVETKPNVKKTGKPSSAVKSKWNGSPRPIGGSNFKGAISELTGHVFATGPNQASEYDNACKHLLNYLGNKFDNRVYLVFERRDYTVGLALLTKPVGQQSRRWCKGRRRVITVNSSGSKEPLSIKTLKTI